MWRRAKQRWDEYADEDEHEQMELIRKLVEEGARWECETFGDSTFEQCDSQELHRRSACIQFKIPWVDGGRTTKANKTQADLSD